MFDEEFTSPKETKSPNSKILLADDDASLRREGRKEERKGEAKDELSNAQEKADRKADEVADLERRT